MRTLSKRASSFFFMLTSSALVLSFILCVGMAGKIQAGESVLQPEPSPPSRFEGVFFNADLLLHICSNFLHLKDLIFLSQADKNFCESLKSQNFRKFSPHGVQLKNSTWLYFHESLQTENTRSQIEKYNDFSHAFFSAPLWRRKIFTAPDSYLYFLADSNTKSFNTFVDSVETQLRAFISVTFADNDEQAKRRCWLRHALSVFLTLHAYSGVAMDLAPQVASAVVKDRQTGMKRKISQQIQACLSMSVWPLTWLSLNTEPAAFAAAKSSSWAVVQSMTEPLRPELEAVVSEEARLARLMPGGQKELGRKLYLLAESYVLLRFAQLIYVDPVAPHGLLARTYAHASEQLQRLDVVTLGVLWRQLKEQDFARSLPAKQKIFLQLWQTHCQRLEVQLGAG